MNIPVGRIIRKDMGDDRWGVVLYMVVNPPIICQTCNAIVQGWKSSEQNVICPNCNHIITHRDYLQCPVCSGNDYHTLRVVNNNNWHYNSATGQVTPYCDKKGIMINICGKSLMQDIKKQFVCLYSYNESQNVKRRITWTSCDDYDPTKPMPQWIIDKYPYQ